MTDAPRPTLRGGPPKHGAPSSVVLILHGGRERGTTPTTATQLSYVRMLDFFWGLRRSTSAAAVYLLRYRVRGWNAGEGTADPVVDARWALDQLTGAHPGLPVGLLGHSMGARAAFAVADQDAVVGVCALAPWLPEHEPLPSGSVNQRYVIAHGTSDRMTSAPLSRDYAERLRRDGRAVARFELPGARHAMLDRPRLWRAFAVRTTLGLVGDRPLPAGVSTALEHAAPGLFDVELSRYDGTA